METEWKKSKIRKFVRSVALLFGICWMVGSLKESNPDTTRAWMTLAGVAVISIREWL